MLRLWRALWRASALAAALAAAAPASAQEPAFTRPVRLVVPFAASGFPDRIARLLAKYLSESFAQRVYVENKPGAGGIVGSADIANAVPDGSALLIASLPSQIITPLINQNPGYDTFKSFTHIAYIGGPPNCFVVAAGGAFKNFGDLVTAARAEPVSYGTAGVSTLGHIFAEYVARKDGLKFIHVPYNGPMFADIISGAVQLGSLVMSTVAGNIQGGNLRVLAVASDKRLPDFPDVPTFRELGFDISAVNWLAVSAPAGLPAPLTARINRDVIAALARPEMAAILRHELIEPVAMTPDEVMELMRAESKRWAPIVAAAGLAAGSH
jgi:tripartite-type tricarboxylate transporter receptor subunit TctC